MIRRDGFRVSRGEIFAEAVSIAAPYFDHTRRVTGSIAVFAPEARVTDDWIARMAKRIIAAAAELSNALGYTSSTEATSRRMSRGISNSR
jgi:DNA-binding IclR family transcriptional regulator